MSAMLLGCLMLLDASAAERTAVPWPTSLAEALESYAQRTGYQVVYRAEVVAGRSTDGAAPGLSPANTLTALLRGTGLRFTFVNERTVAIFKPSEGARGDRARAPDPSSTSEPPDDLDKSNPDRATNETRVDGGNTVTHIGIMKRLAGALAALSGVVAAAASDAPADNSGNATLEEVVVTAQRRSESVIDVPMSIDVVSADEFAKAGAQNFRDIGEVASGVQMNFQGVNTGISIRGVGSAISAISVENNVAIYIDGLYQVDTVSLNEDLPNIDSIQVLKGPQGSLYGRNATGGAILVTTKAPSKNWTGTVEAGYAQENDQSYSGYLSGPISDRIRFSLAAHSRTSDGYLSYSDPVTGAPTDRDVAPQRQQNVQAKLEADITDTLTAKFGYTYSLMDDAESAVYTPFAYIATTEPRPPLISPPALGPDYKAADQIPEIRSSASQFSLGLGWQTPLGPFSLTSGYDVRHIKTVYDLDGSYLNQVLSINQAREPTGQVNLNYQVTSIKDVDLVVGGSYFHDEWDFPYSIKNYVLGAFSSAIMSDQTRSAYQLYADGTYHLTSALSLTVGAGFSHEFQALTYGIESGNGAFAATQHNSATFQKFVPRASLRYEIAPQTNVYASYSQGFRSGNFQVATPPTVPVKQETITAYEIGLKMARPTFRFEAAGFYYNYTNLQVSAVIPLPSCTLTVSLCPLAQETTNGPKAHIYGVDSEVTLAPIDRMEVRLGATYLHARFVSFPNAVGNGANPGNNTDVTQTQDWSGDPLLRSPNFSGNLGFDYKLPTPVGSFVFTPNLKYTTRYVPTNLSTYGPLFPGLVGTQRYVQGGYALLNAQLAWTDPSGHFSMIAYGNNLTDKRYWENYTGNTRGDYGIYALPRIFGGRLRYSF
jgi:iron complex outermembrane receptor protein